MALLREIIGHDQNIKALQGALASGRVAHAYLFSGPRGVGKLTAATAFARALVCSRPAEGDGCGECADCGRVDQGSHPEVRIIRPQGATVKIAQVREMVAGVQFGPAAGRWTVRIVEEAGAMTAEAANSLLKTLEEPLPGVVFVLVTTRPQALLSTILSRCQHLYFQPLQKQQVVRGLAGLTGAGGEEAQLAASLAGGSLGKALDLLSGGLSLRDRALGLVQGLAAAGLEEAMGLAAELSAARDDLPSLLDLMVLWFRDILLYNETGNPGHLINSDRQGEIGDLAGNYTTGRLLEMISATELAKGRIEASANVQLALEALFLRLAGYCPGVARREEVI